MPTEYTDNTENKEKFNFSFLRQDLHDKGMDKNSVDLFKILLIMPKFFQ